MLTGCSQKVTKEYIYIKIPNELLEQQCVAVRHGSGTVKELVEAYIENLGCLKKNEEQLNVIREYNVRHE